MKTRMTILSLLVITVIFALTSCKKDDKSTKQGDYFTYDSKDYELSSGIIEYYGAGSGNGYNFDVTLYSSGISWNTTDMLLEGTGNLATFEMYSSSSSDLANGNYTFDSQNIENQGTFSTGIFGLEFNVTNFTGTIVSISSGTVTVQKTDSNYELTINCKTTDNKTIEGHFNGPLTLIDYSLGKSGTKFINTLK
jgi:hypothetical protein